MPAPDPHALSTDDRPDGGVSVTAEVWPDGNRRHRIARMKAVLRNLSRGGWTCWECREPIPLFRRADARYCGESCRKRAARARRAS